ncbi:Pimeloyl-ACP methyl ester carboxylesterase [Sulfobacillus thermosulfidooxidans DSM 9293]|uniref:Pimeloyl-ACP methyl ester carboxylesterase n=1 Tax=Sulfobacillus thermosulfidooxidans (strain DSM 9293 / VKM B-1269 / AT-1) TaxID=929705 RepID=A0A1W1WIT6_SULTA|nr:alpha/beta hydrolase [Sulfobacillus thermosulfidooxidans]SMC05950.1 Pimeloyl-ACP methyl ester carboxylesterase [Sulfobacillus thermosulfidooxidans DSM 9293]
MRIETPQGAIMVDVYGQSDQVLLLLHGLGSARTTFAGIVPFMPKWQLIMPDLLGFGESAKPPAFSYSLLDYAKNLVELMEQMDLSRVSVVGHSMGGDIALALAVVAPERIDRLIIAEANLLPSRGLKRSSISARADGLPEPEYIQHFHEFFQDLFGQDTASQSLRHYVQTLRQASPMAMYRASQALLDLKEFDVEKTFIQQAIGTLIGERSRGSRQVQQALSSPVPIRLIANAGHDMFVENPKGCALAIQSLMAIARR